MGSAICRCSSTVHQPAHGIEVKGKGLRKSTEGRPITSGPRDEEGWDKDLWDGFSAVSAKVEDGVKFLKDLTTFLSKRAAIEKEYALNLEKLCRMPIGEKEKGTLHEAWSTMVVETRRLAQVHSDLSEKLLWEVKSEPALFLRKAKVSLATLKNEGQRLTKSLVTAELNYEKCKSRYEQIKNAEQDAKEKYQQATYANESHDAIERASKRLQNEARRAAAADQEYQQSVTQLAIAQQAYYHSEMPPILRELQFIDRERIACVQNCMHKTLELQEEIPKAVEIVLGNCRSALAKIDVKADMKEFVEKTRSGSVPPPIIEYWPYNPESRECLPAHQLPEHMVNNFEHTGDQDSSSSASSPLASMGSPSLFSRIYHRPLPALPSEEEDDNSDSAGDLPSQHKGKEHASTVDAAQNVAPAAASASSDTPQAGASGICRVRALYDYKSSSGAADRLEVKCGDIIKVIAKRESGWWLGELNGRRGYFPGNEWVEILEETDGGSEAKKETATSTQPAVAGPADKSSAQASSAASSSSTILASQKCLALHQFQSSKPGELSITPGEILFIEYGWLFGENMHGEKGQFPYNYVKLLS